MTLRKKCIKYADDISTDLIIAGKYTKTVDFAELAAHTMEDLDPSYKEKIKGGAFIVAGENFGCGSSREQAPVALKESGAACIVAKTFSRIFYRNAVNIGLPIVECDTSQINDGDVLEYTLGGDKIINATTGKTIPVVPLPPIMVEILTNGGIIGHFRKKGGY